MAKATARGAKNKIKVHDKDFEVDVETGEIEEIILEERRIKVNWILKRNEYQSYLNGIARLDEELSTLMPGETWETVVNLEIDSGNV